LSQNVSVLGGDPAHPHRQLHFGADFSKKDLGAPETPLRGPRRVTQPPRGTFRGPVWGHLHRMDAPRGTFEGGVSQRGGGRRFSRVMERHNPNTPRPMGTLPDETVLGPSQIGEARCRPAPPLPQLHPPCTTGARGCLGSVGGPSKAAAGTPTPPLDIPDFLGGGGGGSLLMVGQTSGRDHLPKTDPTAKWRAARGWGGGDEDSVGEESRGPSAEAQISDFLGRGDGGSFSKVRRTP
jgi:hypothetical protein